MKKIFYQCENKNLVLKNNNALGGFVKPVNKMSDSREMPKYQSHKQVWALKIKEIVFDSDLAKSDNRETDGSAIITPEENGYTPFEVDYEYCRKHEPKVGGYYVMYKDGYKSFSPAEAFVGGYTLVKEMVNEVIEPALEMGLGDREVFMREKTFNFGGAIEALRAGYCVARAGWNSKNMFVCKQVSSEINADIIPKMQSLPQTAKDILHDGEDDTRPIFYANQMIIVNTKTRSIDSWVASSSDTFATDWHLV